MPLRWSVDPPVPHTPPTPPSLPHGSRLDLHCLEVWRPMWFEAWGLECGADDDMTPPSPARFQGPHSAVLLWSYSQYCSISHGEEIILRWSDQVVTGTGRAVREDVYKRGKEETIRKQIHSSKHSTLFGFILQPSHSSTSSNPLFFPCRSLCPPASGLCCLQRH